MNTNELKQIDAIRKKGYRPQVVGCFIYDKKLLFVYDKKYDIWGFPQGGIDNNETFSDAFWREMKEELGNNFLLNCNKDIAVIGEDILNFPVHLHGSRELTTDSGEKIKMIGKKYFFITATCHKSTLNINKSEFDDYSWKKLKEMPKLLETIYQKGKKRMIVNAIKILKEKKLI